MVNKKQIKHIKNLRLEGFCRKDIRNNIIKEINSEESGHFEDGLTTVNCYAYIVEILSDNKKILISRPTRFGGYDFRVIVERFRDSKDRSPSYIDIDNDIDIKYQENPEECNKLYEIIKRVCDCEDLDKILLEYTFKFKGGFSVEMLLKILKWLFIEQDIKYWNYEGRYQLLRRISSHAIPK